MNRSLHASIARLAILTAVCGSLASAAMIHQYTFDGGPQAFDSVGTANGILIGGASISGGVLNLGGSPDFVQFANHLVPISAPYSVGLKYQTNGGAQTGITEFISQGSAGGPGFYMGGNGSTGYRLTDLWTNPAGAFPTDANWHQIVLVVAAGQSFFYIDGALADTVNFSIFSTNLGTDTRLGTQFAFAGEFFTGRMDDVRIWDGALTAGEVAALESSGVPEPATSLLIALGLGSCALWRRKRRESRDHQSMAR